MTHETRNSNFKVRASVDAAVYGSLNYISSRARTHPIFIVSRKEPTGNFTRHFHHATISFSSLIFILGLQTTRAQFRHKKERDYTQNSIRNYIFNGESTERRIINYNVRINAKKEKDIISHTLRYELLSFRSERPDFRNQVAV